MANGITKNHTKKEVKNILQKKVENNNPNKKLAAFFGKLPHIEDGLIFQKKIRSEWK